MCLKSRPSPVPFYINIVDWNICEIFSTLRACTKRGTWYAISPTSKAKESFDFFWSCLVLFNSTANYTLRVIIAGNKHPGGLSIESMACNDQSMDQSWILLLQKYYWKNCESLERRQHIVETSLSSTRVSFHFHAFSLPFSFALAFYLFFIISRILYNKERNWIEKLRIKRFIK